MAAPPEFPVPRSWVFWSTRDTINDEIPSVTATIETVLAVLVYWVFATYFETYFLLLISVAVAPLVLLRSDESVALGVKWFTTWERDQFHDARAFHERDPRERRLAFAMVVLCPLLASFMSYFLTRYWAGEDARFWHYLAIGAIAVELPVSLMLVAIGHLQVIPPLERLWGLRELDSETLSHGVRLLIFLAMIIVGASLGTTVAAPKVLGLTVGALVAMSALGIFGVSLIIRLGATLRHIPAGLRALPRNFRRLTLCTSPLQEPELVPGLIPGETFFTLRTAARRLYTAPPFGYMRLLTSSFATWVMLIWFLPGWLYRITLKSTAWFWWPLAFLGGDLRRAVQPELFRQRIMETLWAKASIALAILTLTGFILSNVVLKGALFHANPLLTVLGFLFVVDWSLRPWQVLAVMAALLSIGILLWIDVVSRDYRYATEHKDDRLLKQTNRQFGWIERLVRLRLLLVLFFWLLVGIHTVLYFNSLKCWFALPSNAERWAEWVYGNRLPLPNCS